MKLKNIEFISVGHVKQGRDWHFQPHFHPFHELIIVVRGRIRVVLNNRTIIGKTGDVLFYPAGQVHEEDNDGSEILETLFFAFDSADAANDIPPVTHDSNGRLRLLSSWLYAGRDLRMMAGPESSKAYLQVVLSELLSLVRSEENSLVLKVREFVRQHIDESLTLDLLARRAGLSKFHFLRRYKELTGHTPLEDVRAIRVDFARDLLLTTDLPLKAIAPKAGLGDQYQLCHMFRRYLDMRPSDLRRDIERR